MLTSLMSAKFQGFELVSYSGMCGAGNEHTSTFLS